MDNPYWKTEGQTHNIDTDSIRRICFELGTIIEASNSLASDLAYTEPENGIWPASSPLFTLHREMAEKEVLKFLLQLSLMVRTYDDIMKDSNDADAYAVHAKNTDGDNSLGAVEGGELLVLREACNKVIHATKIRASYEKIERWVPEGTVAPTEEAEDVWFLDGEMELEGSHKGRPWEATLSVKDFVDTILERVNFKPAAKK
jgi:hypothetical protein